MNDFELLFWRIQHYLLDLDFYQLKNKYEQEICN